jgi:hypothetical protein
MTWDEVVSFARDLPEVEEGTAYGTPALGCEAASSAASARTARRL